MNKIPQSHSSRGIHPPLPGEGAVMVAEEEGAALAEEEEAALAEEEKVPLLRRARAHRAASLTSLEGLSAEWAIRWRTTPLSRSCGGVALPGRQVSRRTCRADPRAHLWSL